MQRLCIPTQPSDAAMIFDRPLRWFWSAVALLLVTAAAATAAPKVTFSNVRLKPSNNQRWWDFTGDVTVRNIPAGPNVSPLSLSIYAELRSPNGTYIKLADMFHHEHGAMQNGAKLTDAQMQGFNTYTTRAWQCPGQLTSADSGKAKHFAFNLIRNAGPVDYRIYAQVAWCPDMSLKATKRDTYYVYDILGPYPWLPPMGSALAAGDGMPSDGYTIDFSNQTGGAQTPPTQQPGNSGGTQPGGNQGGNNQPPKPTGPNPPGGGSGWQKPPSPPGWHEPLVPPPPKPAGRRYRVFIDGQLMPTQAPPTEVNGRILVGLADIFRALGASVVWDGAQRKITATRGQRVVQLWIGRKTALVDGGAVPLDVPPLILAGGKTYVPVRFVSQALGAGVAYDATNAAVMITTSSMPPLAGAATTVPYTPPTPAQGTVQVSICRQTGLRDTGRCPNTTTMSFAPQAIPGPCTTHGLGAKLVVLSPSNMATVPEHFGLYGTGVPGNQVRVTVIAEATLKATGQDAKSTVLDKAETMVGKDGKWSFGVNARAVSRDQRVVVKHFQIHVSMRRNGRTLEVIRLVCRPQP